MKTTVWLKDNVNAVKAECLKRNRIDISGHDYSEDIIDKAIQAQIGNNLRYNTKGKTYDNQFGVVSEYTNKLDVPIYNTDEELAKWEFVGHVRNSASRIYRGLKPI